MGSRANSGVRTFTISYADPSLSVVKLAVMLASICSANSIIIKLPLCTQCTESHQYEQGHSNPTRHLYAADPREANAVITGTPVVFTQYPHSFFKDPSTSVPNPLKLYGQSGDTVIIKWNRATDAFFIFQVIPAQQRMFWGELAADAPAGLLQDIDVNVTDPLTPGTVPTDPVTVSDLFDLAHNAKDGDRCLVIWDNNTGSYKMLECVHTTTRFLGTLFEDFDDAPATFKVDFVRSFNGNDPNPTTEIEVENRWNWRTGLEGDEIEVVWDPTTETWYPIQIKPYENLLPLYVY